MFTYRTQYAEAHQWMMHIVANITGLAIASIFPLLPAAEPDQNNVRAMQKRDVYNRIIYPLDNMNYLLPAIAIMWCHGETAGLEPNHFAPVVP